MTRLIAAMGLIAGLQAPGPQKPGDVKARPIRPPSAEVEVRPVSGEPARFEIAVRPLDMLGRPFGPGRGADLALSASAGRLLGALEDAGDGRYTQVLELAEGDSPAAVELRVEVAGVPSQVPLIPPEEPVVEDPLLADRVSRARADLARRLDVDPEKIELVDASRVTWRDGSLGCPRPGMGYTQALVAGVRVQLRADGTVYSYHGRREGDVTLCENPSDPIPIRSR